MTAWDGRSIDADAEILADPAGLVAGRAVGLAPARVDPVPGEAADLGDAGRDDRDADVADPAREAPAQRLDAEAAAAIGNEVAAAAPDRCAGALDDATGHARLGGRRREGEKGE